jgi:uncharacterized membrane protein YoaK (UPF0700 family)
MTTPQPLGQSSQPTQLDRLAAFFGRRRGDTVGLAFRWLMLAFIAGLVNAGGLLGFQRFVTHITGFGTLFGVAVSDGDLVGALGMMIVPSLFLVGIMVGAFLTDAKMHRGREPRYGIVLIVVALLLAATAVLGRLGCFGLFGSGLRPEDDILPLAMLCGASGLLNAVVTTASYTEMRATHLTGITTDLGIGLMRVYFGNMAPERKERELARAKMRFGIIASFATGGVAGAMLFREVQYLGFFLPCALSLYVGTLGRRVMALKPDPLP